MPTPAAPPVATYKGRPISDLSHEELLQAYTHISRQYTKFLHSQIAAYDLERELDHTRAFFRTRARTVGPYYR